MRAADDGCQSAAYDGRRKKSILNTEVNIETNTAPSGFAALGITGNLLKSTIASGFAEPKPIQVKAIPPHLAGRDIIAIGDEGRPPAARIVALRAFHLDDGCSEIGKCLSSPRTGQDTRQFHDSNAFKRKLHGVTP